MGGLKSLGGKSAPGDEKSPARNRFFHKRGVNLHIVHEQVNLHTMPSVELPITDGDDAPPIAADAPPFAAHAPPITAGAADDAASDEDSLSSEVSRHAPKALSHLRHCGVLLMVLLMLTKELMT